MSLVGTTISEGEKQYIVHGAEAGVRVDGRGRLDFRAFTVETDLLPQTNGSARVRLNHSDVLVGIKGELSDTDAEEGKVEVCIDTVPSVQIALKSTGTNEGMLSDTIQRMVDAVFDLKSLVVVPGQHAWDIYVDVQVLDTSGNILDAVCLAVAAALYTAKLPKVTVHTDAASGDIVELEVGDEDTEALVDVNCWSSLPIAVTLVRIGKTFIVDPSDMEELCQSGRFTIAVNEKGKLAGIHIHSGSTTPAALHEMSRAASKIGSWLIEQLKKKVEDSMSRAGDSADNGFLAGNAAVC